MKKILLLVGLLSISLLVTACSQTTKQAATNTGPLAEVSKHNTANDCWMLINGKTYNVTSYISSHPGGDVILNGCGQDATVMFNGVAKHAGKAQDLLSQYLVK